MDTVSPLNHYCMTRIEALRGILEEACSQTALVSQLGFLSRDLYALTAHCRQRCLYCMGSMGSVIPLALGMAIGQPGIRVLALEGDGSLLMNFGTLVSARRYGSPNLGIIIFDNRSYESTGGQQSQPEGFAIEELCAAVGLPTSVAFDEPAVRGWISSKWPRASSPSILIIKTVTSSAHRRIPESPLETSARFREWLQSVDRRPIDDNQSVMDES